ncbi:MAG TPA: VWA domain-containing protein [Pyrinomonadaceae bacterium]|jgi:VWFA-related protein|nr:VWA domain-containing protein [Pyrinomonadaceae bacterium]
MIKQKKLIAHTLGACVLLSASLASNGQTPQEVPQDTRAQSIQDQSDVLRIYTQIVQTDVMVFDKEGHFVNNLKGSDFELRIDGTSKPIEFFEKVTAGSINEEVQIAAARGSSRPNAARVIGPAPLDRGRPIFFFVDDLHLDLSAMLTTRKLITHFIDQEMGQNDEAAITSASGQIGFLQQLTENKAVLHAALDRLKTRSLSVRDSERPPMTEYQGLLIENYDHDVTDYFVDATIRDNPGMPRDTADAMVKARARAMAQQGAAITTNTLAALEGLVKSANSLPGRKLLFFISGGFLLDDRNSDSRSRLQRITSAAARSGVVIYSMDARGLVASLSDASTPTAFDVSGRLQHASSGELSATQDSMNALAADTGGKAVFNTNSLEPGLGRALKESATYYLLAWKPETESRQSKFHRIEVKVVGRPDLTVQVRRGFFDREPENKTAKKKSEKSTAAKNEAEAAKSPDAELRKALLEPLPNREIPVSLSLNYLNAPGKGLMLSTAMQVPNEFLTFVPTNGKQTAVVSLVGAVYDHAGNPGAAFKNRITIQAPSVEATKEGRDLTYGYPVYLKPGLYQVRVGVRDEANGHYGTAYSWIEIPDLSSNQLALSSVMMGVRTPLSDATNASNVAGNMPNPVAVSIDHNFTPNGFLRFLVITYNAALAPADAKPDVAIQVQIVRDQQPIITTPLRKLTIEGLADLTQIPYAAEVSLDGLPVGRYILQVTVVDRVAKKSASQQNRFEIN